MPPKIWEYGQVEQISESRKYNRKWGKLIYIEEGPFFLDERANRFTFQSVLKTTIF